MIQPFTLKPALKDYLWGGNTLKQAFHTQSDFENIAEYWMLSALPDGKDTIETGEYTGKIFQDFIKEYPQCVSDTFTKDDTFPILIKCIDAGKTLSVQVHPNDEYAKIHENGLGKTEMWVILECQPDAFLYLGLEKPSTKEEIEKHIEQGTLTEILHKQEIKKGDVYFINSGTIHAIGAGTILAEIQQSSATTYRLYDFNRKDAQGQLRELHIKKALDVAQLKQANTTAPGAHMVENTGAFVYNCLAKCDFFTVHSLQLNEIFKSTATPQSFVSILCVEGIATFTQGSFTLELTQGTSLFIPAGSEPYSLKGKGAFILTTL